MAKKQTAAADEAATDTAVADQAAAEGAAAGQAGGEADQSADAGAGEQGDAPAAALVPVRVLIDGAYGRINDVAHIAVDQVVAAEAAGEVDSHPDAVAYARSLVAD